MAVFGNVVAPSPERGVYRTRDGGKTWQRVLFRDDKSAGIEVQIDMNNPNVLYASLWEAYRQSWQMSSGGPGTGLFKSTDGGDTWTEFTRAPGLPAQGPIGKIGIAVSRVDSNRLWVLLEHENGGLFMSDDAGGTWKLVNDDRNIRQRAFYYSRVYADPKQKDTVWMLNVNMYRSTDAGKTLQNVRAPHGDYHDLWIDPDDSAHLVNGNDGGGTVSWNTGETWTDLEFPTAQIYRLSVTNTFPYFACGGQQDNSTVCAPVSALPGDLGPGYFSAGGGESGYVTPHPTNHEPLLLGQPGRAHHALRQGHGPRSRHPALPALLLGRAGERICRSAGSGRSRSSSIRSTPTRSTSRRSTCGRRPTTARAGPGSART